MKTRLTNDQRDQLNEWCKQFGTIRPVARVIAARATKELGFRVTYHHIRYCKSLSRPGRGHYERCAPVKTPRQVTTTTSDWYTIPLTLSIRINWPK